jgi:uncharacterized phage protein (TIGR02218 family)
VTIGSKTALVFYPIAFSPADAATAAAGQLNAEFASLGIPAIATAFIIPQGSPSANDPQVVIRITDFFQENNIIEKTGDSAGAMHVESFADGYLNWGLVTWLTGNNVGASMEIKNYFQSSHTLQLFLPMPADIQAGDKFAYYPGCDKRRTTCQLKFSNIFNFRGEPDIPGLDTMYQYPGSNF